MKDLDGVFFSSLGVSEIRIGTGSDGGGEGGSYAGSGGEGGS